MNTFDENGSRISSALSARVLDIVKRCGPIRAADIATELSATDARQVAKQVNRLLYGELRAFVTQNDVFQWSMADHPPAAPRIEKRTSEVVADVGASRSSAEAVERTSPVPMVVLGHLADIARIKGRVTGLRSFPDGHFVLQFEGSQGGQSFIVLSPEGVTVKGAQRQYYYERLMRGEGEVVALAGLVPGSPPARSEVGRESVSAPISDGACATTHAPEAMADRDPQPWEETSLERAGMEYSTVTALRRAGVETLGDAAARSEDELLAIHGVGQLTIERLRQLLASHGHSGFAPRRAREVVEPSQEGAPQPAVSGGTPIDVPPDFHGVPLEDLQLSVRAFNGLRRVGINTLGDLVGWTWESVGAIRHLGVKSVEDLAERLKVLKRTVVRELPAGVVPWSRQRDDQRGYFDIPAAIRDWPLERLGLQVRTFNGLVRAGIEVIGDLHGYTWEFVHEMPYLGVHSFHDLADCLLAAISTAGTSEPEDVETAGAEAPSPWAQGDLDGLLEPADAQRLAALGIVLVGDLRAYSTDQLRDLGLPRHTIHATLRALQARGWPLDQVLATATDQDVAAAAEPAWRGPRELLVWLMEQIPERRFEACERYFANDEPLQAIADDWGLSRARVYQIVRKGQADFRRELAGLPAPTWTFLQGCCDPVLDALELLTVDALYDLMAEEMAWPTQPTPEDLNALRCIAAQQPDVSVLAHREHFVLCRSKVAARLRLDDLQEGAWGPLPEDHPLLPAVPEDLRSLFLAELGRLVRPGTQELTAERALAIILRRAGRPLPFDYLLAEASRLPGVRAHAERSFYRAITDKRHFQRFGRGVYGLPGQELPPGEDGSEVSREIVDVELEAASDLAASRGAFEPMPIHDSGGRLAVEPLPEARERRRTDRLTGIFAGVDPAEGAFKLVEASKLIVARAEQLGLRRGPWSLAELAATEDDFAWLRAWAQALRYERLRQYLEAGPTHMEAVGLLMMLLAAEAGRRAAREGTLWAAVRDCYGADVRRLLFAGRTQPTQGHQDALELAARRQNLRHVFGKVGAQHWFHTVYLQFGFTWRGLARLPEWLDGRARSVAVDALLDPTTGSTTFRELWRQLQLFRRGGLAEGELDAYLAASPWVLPGRAGDVVAALRAPAPATASRTGPLRGREGADARDPEERPPLVEDVRLAWEVGAAPAFTAVLGDVDALGLTASEYQVFVEDRQSAMLVRQEDGAYEAVPTATLRLPADRPEVTVRLVGSDAGEALAERVRLWDPEEDLSAFRLPEGAPVDPWAARLQPTKPYALRLAPDLALAPPPALARRFEQVTWAMLQPGWPGTQAVLLGDDTLWTPNVAMRQAGAPPTWAGDVRATAVAPAHGRLGLEVDVVIEVPEGVVVRAIRYAGHERAFAREAAGVRTSVPVPYGRAYDRALHLSLQVVRGSERARIALVARLEGLGAAIQQAGGWRLLDERGTLTVAEAHDPIGVILPRVWQGRESVPEDWAIVEGSVWRERPGRVARPLRHLAGLGASLAVRAGRYNAEGSVLTLARSVVDPGGVAGVALSPEGAFGSVTLAHRSELDERHRLVLWTTDGPIVEVVPRPADDTGTCWTAAETSPAGELVACAVAYGGARTGAWWAPAWSGALAEVPEERAGATAAWLRWLALPVLAADHLPGVRAFARRHAARVLPAWLLAESAPDGFEYDPGKAEAWLSAVREVYGAWQPRPEEAVAIVQGLAARLTTEEDAPKYRFAAACHRLARAHPLLMARLAYAWCQAPQNARAAAEAVEFFIVSAIGDGTRDELEQACAAGLEVDVFFLRRSLIDFGVRQLYGDALDVRSENNLSLAIGAMEPFRRLLAVRLADEIRRDLSAAPRR